MSTDDRFGVVLHKASTETQTLASGQARIALVAFNSLGDGLLYLLIAHNLRLNGFRVSYFGNIAHQLKQWLPELEIHPYPAAAEFNHAFDDYDLVLMSPPQFIRDRMDGEPLEQMKQTWLLICFRAPANWQHDLTKRLQAKCSPRVFQEIKPLLGSAGSIRYRKFAQESVVDITLDYLHARMQLQRLERHVPLSPPSNLQHRRHTKRIVISPDSANPEKKDWTPESFLALAGKLKEHGLDPVFVVAPDNHAEWLKRTAGRYMTPCFADIGELAAYIYESAALIANDSGNGHLASFLGIPVVTIYRKNNPNFHWRPDWSRGKVVGPWLTIPWRGRSIWRPFIRIPSIIKALDELLCPLHAQSF